MARRWAPGTYLGRLQADLERWRDEALISAETMELLLDDARRREEARLAGEGAPDTGPTAQRAEQGAGGGALIVMRLGLAAASLAALGVLSFIAANWADMGAGSKLLLLGGLEIAVLAAAGLFKARGNEAGAEGFALFGAASFAGALALIGQAFNLEGTTAGFLFAWTAAAVAVALALDLHWTRLFAVVLASAYSWTSLIQNGFPDGLASPMALGLLAVLAAASWLKRDVWSWRLLCVTLTTHLCAAAFHLAERAGADFVWGAALAALAGAAAAWLADWLARGRSLWGAGWAAVTLGVAGGVFALVLVFAEWDYLGGWTASGAAPAPAWAMLAASGAVLAAAGLFLWFARRTIGWHFWSAAGALYLALAPAHFYPAFWDGDASAGGVAAYGALGVLALAVSGLAAKGWPASHPWGARTWTGWAAWLGGLAACVASVALAIALTEQRGEAIDLWEPEAARRWAWASWVAAAALAATGAAAMWAGRRHRFWALSIPGGVTLATAMLGWPIALGATQAGGAATPAFFTGAGVLAVLLAADAGLLRRGRNDAPPESTAVWPSMATWLALTAIMAAAAALTPPDWASFAAWSVFMAASATALWRGLALGHRILSYGGLAGLVLSSLYLFVIRLGGLMGAAGVFLASAAFLAALALIAGRLRRKAAEREAGASASASVSAEGGAS